MRIFVMFWLICLQNINNNVLVFRIYKMYLDAKNLAVFKVKHNLGTFKRL